MHDRVVTLEERFEDLKERYGETEKSRVLIGGFMERSREIERKIFGKLSIHPAELIRHLEEDSRGVIDGP